MISVVSYRFYYFLWCNFYLWMLELCTEPKINSRSKNTGVSINLLENFNVLVKLFLNLLGLNIHIFLYLFLNSNHSVFYLLFCKVILLVAVFERYSYEKFFHQLNHPFVFHFPYTVLLDGLDKLIIATWLHLHLIDDFDEDIPDIYLYVRHWLFDLILEHI